MVSPYREDEDPLDPKRKIFDALAQPGGTAVDPAGGGPEVGGMETMPPIKDAPGNIGPISVSGENTTYGAGQPMRDFSRLVGYDKGKFDDPNKQSAKYQMGRTLSAFDSTKGLTPEVLAALNQLGFGSFSGQGDKLSLQGLTDAGRKAGLVGDYKDADFNVGYKTGNGKWGYQDPAYEAANPQTGGVMGPVGGSGASSALDPLLSGDPMAKIQAAIAQLSGPRGNAQALLQQLLAGGR